MAAITFSLGDLFEQTFGYKSQAFNPQFPVVYGDQKTFRAETGAYGSPYYASDANGREYYMPVSITYPNGSGSAANLLNTDANAPMTTWQLPYPVISVASRKTIVETPLTERRGTVKELINIQDYEITIKGFIINSDGNEFPENDVITLRNIYEQNIALSIQCPLTDIFLLRPDRSGSDQVVIRELTFPAITGVKNVRAYQLRMVSDEAFNLISIS